MASPASNAIDLSSRWRWPLAIFVLTAMALVALGALSYRDRGLARHLDDLQMRALQAVSGDYRKLVLSDSVTENAVAGVALAPDVYPLMSHGWLRLMGQYLMFRRMTEQASLREVSLILLPDVLYTEVNNEFGGRIRHTYTDTVFTRPDETAIMRASGDAEAGRRFIWLELFYRSFNPASRRLSPRSFTHVPASRPDQVGPVDTPSRERIVARTKIMADRELPPQNRYVLSRWAADCARLHLRCRLAVAPMPASLPRMNLDRIRAHAPGVEVLDLNAVVTWPDGAFYDGQHLRDPDWTAYYRTVLADLGLIAFGEYRPPVAPWQGQPLAFGQGADLTGLSLGSGFHPRESWGVWTSASRAELFVNVPASGSPRQLVLDGVVHPRRGAQEVTVLVEGVAICGSTAAQPGDLAMSCPWPAERSGVVRIAIEMSYVASPMEAGIADPRLLGVGLRTIALR